MSVTQLPARSSTGSVLPVISRWIVDPVASCLPVLRSEIRSFAQRAGLAPEEVDEALLITNELVSNAIHHARTQCRVTLRLTASTVRIFVSDHSTAVPVLRAQVRHARRGRGIRIVAGLARRWGWTGHRAGKTVWASLDRAPA
jgi:anti-sigma regulatory factor (Ser/Thr protein kinase)